MTSVYIAHLLPSFAGDACDRLLTDMPTLAPLLQVFEDWMMHLAEREWHTQKDFFAEHAPDLVAEIAGLLAGARRAGLDEPELELRLENGGLRDELGRWRDQFGATPPQAASARSTASRVVVCIQSSGGGTPLPLICTSPFACAPP